MSNELTTPVGGLPATEDLVSGMQRAIAESPSATTMPFLRLARDGAWMFGADDEEISEDSEWAVHPGSFQHGWVSWGDGELLGEVMCSVSEPRAVQADLPATGASWSEQVAFMLACVDGPEKGQQVLYKTSSRGGRQAYARLAQEIVTQAQIDPENVVPIVVLDVDSYTHKKYGKIYTPIFEVVSFGDSAGNIAEPEEEEPEKPARKKRGTSKKAAAKNAAKPTRQRRRRRG